MRSPRRTALAGLPDHVTIYEVGPRDGLQNEAEILSVETKAEFVRRLASSGLSAIELTSFVPPKWIPQLADAEELLALLGPLPGRHPVLVPNERGLDRALAAGVKEIAVFASATESFAQRNLNKSVAASLQMFSPVVKRATEAGLAVRGYVSMCFGDPWEGDVAVSQVTAAAGGLATLWSPWKMASRRWTRRLADSGAVRTRAAPPAISPPKTWCGSCTDSILLPG